MAHYNGHLLSYNGACVTHHGSQQQLFNQTISKSLSQQILEHLKQFDVIPMINDETFMYVNDVFHNTLHLETGDFNIIEYESRGGNFQLCEWHDLAARLNFPLNKILIAGEPAYLQKYHEAQSTRLSKKPSPLLFPLLSILNLPQKILIKRVL